MTTSDPVAAPPSLGLAALARAQAALAAGVKEEPFGSNTGPEVREYLSHCVRHGSLLGLTAAEWCASFASWCIWSAWASGRTQDFEPDALAWPKPIHPWDIPPVGYRAAVSELVVDAKETKTWFDVTAIKSGMATIAPGMLAIFGRAGHDPRNGGEGHVAIVESVSTGGLSYVVISGNSNNAVSRETRTLYDENEPLVGVISLDGPGA